MARINSLFDNHRIVEDKNKNKVSVFFEGPALDVVKKLDGFDELQEFTLPEPTLEEYFLPIYNGRPEEP